MLKVLRLLLLTIASSLLLSGCGGGGGSGGGNGGGSSNATATLTALVPLPSHVVVGSDAVLEEEFTNNSGLFLMLNSIGNSAQSKNNLTANGPSITLNQIALTPDLPHHKEKGKPFQYVDEAEITQPCRPGKTILAPGVQCHYLLDISDKGGKNPTAYTGNLAFHTTAGTFKTPLKVHFDADSPTFNNKLITLSSTPFYRGATVTVQLQNPTDTVINDIKLHFPTNVQQYITNLHSILALFPDDSARYPNKPNTASFTFNIKNSQQAEQALQTWRKDGAAYTLDAANASPKVLYANIYDSLSTDTQSITISSSEIGTAKQVKLTNMGPDTITQIHTTITEDSGAFVVQHPNCSPLKQGKSCSIDITANHTISHAAIHGYAGSLQITGQTRNGIKAEANLPLSVDTSTAVTSTSGALIVGNKTNTVTLRNTGHADWAAPQTKIDYKLLNAKGSATGLSVSSKSSCLSTGFVTPNASCTLLIKAPNKLAHQPFTIEIANSNTHSTITLPYVQGGEITPITAENPKAIKTNHALYLNYLYTNGSKESKIKSIAVNPHFSGATFNPITNACKNNETLNPNQSCRIQWYVPKATIASITSGAVKTTLTVTSTDGDSVPHNINHTIVATGDTASSLLNAEDMISQATISDSGLTLHLKNNSAEPLSNPTVGLSDWISDLVSSPTTAGSVLKSGQSITLNYPLNTTTNKWYGAIKKNLTNVEHNATQGKTLTLDASNLDGNLMPSIINNLFPRFSNNRVSQSMVFTEAGSQIATIDNTSDQAYTISSVDSSHMGLGLKLATDPADSLPPCSLGSTLAANGGQCILEVIAPASAEANSAINSITVNFNAAHNQQPDALSLKLSANLIQNINYDPSNQVLDIPTTGTRTYNMKLVNNEHDAVWLPATIKVIHQNGHQAEHTRITTPTLNKGQQSCSPGVTVPAQGSCYTGLQVASGATAGNYTLHMTGGNLFNSQGSTTPFEITNDAHTTVELLNATNHVATTQASQGDNLIVRFIPPQNWHHITTNQTYQVSSADKQIIFTSGSSCTLHYNKPNQPCSVIVHIAAAHEPAKGVKLQIKSNTAIPVNTNSLSFNITGHRWQAISAGSRHVCAIDLAGRAYCWGNNIAGQLGNPNVKSISRLPVQVVNKDNNPLTHVTQISAGGPNSCAIANSKAYCWGSDEFGQVGNGLDLHVQYDYATPVFTTNLTDHVKSISTGYHHICAINQTNALYCWGSNTYGQLGDGRSRQSGEIFSDAPKAVSHLKNVKSVSAGDGYTCAITQDNNAYCWGHDQHGQLGSNSHNIIPVLGGYAVAPVKVSVAGTALAKGVQSISAGGVSIVGLSLHGAHTCAISLTGQAYCWGSNRHGQLGNQHHHTATTPTAVYVKGTSLNHGVQSISTGGAHTCAISTTGQAYCWGWDLQGQLGNGSEFKLGSAVPVQVTDTHFPQGVKSISAGEDNSCAISKSNQAYCWGENNDGQLGAGIKSSFENTPVAVGLDE